MAWLSNLWTGISQGTGGALTGGGGLNSLWSGMTSEGGGMLIQGIGTGMQAYNEYEAGKFEKEIYYGRAAMMEGQAKRGEKVSIEKQKIVERQLSERLSTAKAQTAKSGVRVGKGSPVKVSKASQAAAELDKKAIGEQYAYEARLLREQAQWQRKIGRSRYKAGKWQAGTSLMTAGAGFFGGYA